MLAPTITLAPVDDHGAVDFVDDPLRATTGVSAVGRACDGEG